MQPHASCVPLYLHSIHSNTFMLMQHSLRSIQNEPHSQCLTLQLSSSRTHTATPCTGLQHSGPCTHAATLHCKAGKVTSTQWKNFIVNFFLVNRFFRQREGKILWVLKKNCILRKKIVLRETFVNRWQTWLGLSKPDVPGERA